MKRMIVCLLALVMLVSVFAFYMPETAYAAIATGTSGTCSWEISDDGVLTIYPTDGVSGQLQSYISGNGSWYNYRTQITKVVVEPGVKAGTGCYGLFSQLSNCTKMDLSGLDTSAVTNMNSMFRDCSKLTSLDVSGFDTSNVTTMYYMFTGCSKLTSLDVSGWNTGNVTNMGSMFNNGCLVLSSVILGENFSFKGKNISRYYYQAILPMPPSSTTTGKWIREDEAYGPYTPAELRDQYGDNASVWAGTWVWEELPVSYKLVFQALDDVTGAMPIQKIKADEDGIINSCAFRKFNYHFDHWEADNGAIYSDGDTISANTYAAGDVITLTAVFEKNINEVNMQNGEFDITLHADEQAVFDSIPAGTAYQVYEETADGWVLVAQVNSSGEIVPLDESMAQFVNEYNPAITSVQIRGTKYMDGHAARAGQFTFELVENDTVIQTKSNEDGGFILFDAIEYMEPGLHTYTVREVTHDSTTIAYDRHEETVTVEISDDGEGNLSAEVTYDEDGVVFSNYTMPAVLYIKKVAEGLTNANLESLFRFRVTFQNDDGTLMEGNSFYWYVTDDDAA